jgi:hypothetical protein
LIVAAESAGDEHRQSCSFSAADESRSDNSATNSASLDMRTS